ncbi:hypothetical protein SAMN00768000_1415 [Sulfobacillus thermosulfidooxidans DSM 9293]|uniref:Uncharacterized protein n=1 Tax=Sulfobacillus thermosulfidooxidans (strain DSM 9293 / VKM B-1269 / AT-1) TaxID=929705 RepID=A0A1W1WCH3_SULTA|nr:hypothetical protein SAMN00768000_1415 [Sulfobacillus thermosulfidooxidans DSM 9293]
MIENDQGLKFLSVSMLGLTYSDILGTEILPVRTEELTFAMEI